MFEINPVRLIVLILATVLVAALLALDVRCSRTRDADVPTTLRHVRAEMAEGRRELASQKDEQFAEQLRGLRVMAKRYVEEGKTAEARKVFAAIAELENARKKESTR